MERNNKKKGFTLVELLAVIAILAILVVLAVPSILKMFNESKKNTFITQAQSIYKTSEQQYISDQIKESTTNKVYCKTKSDNTHSLSMSGNNKVYYYIEYTNGKITSFQVTDGSKYSITLSDETQVSINEIKKENLDNPTITNMSCSGLSGNTPTYTSYAVGDRVTLTSGTDQVSEWRVITASPSNTSTVTLFKSTNTDSNTYAFDTANARSSSTYCDHPSAGCNVYAAVEGTYTNANGGRSGTVTMDSTIKGLVDTYGAGLSLSTNLQEIRLITLDELVLLGCENASTIFGGNCTPNAEPWVYSTNYWTMTPPGLGGSEGVCCVFSDGVFNFNYANIVDEFGIRPVIVVSKSVVSNVITD